jgi:hypothetical protein
MDFEDWTCPKWAQAYWNAAALGQADRWETVGANRVAIFDLSDADREMYKAFENKSELRIWKDDEGNLHSCLVGYKRN